MDRIKLSIGTFISPTTLSDGWNYLYRGHNIYRNFWKTKKDGISYYYYPASRYLVLDFSAPAILYGHNLYDYKTQDNDSLYSIVNKNLADLLPGYSWPSIEDWNVSYIELTKNYVCTRGTQRDSYLNKIKKIQSLPYFKKKNFEYYERGILIKNSRRCVRGYDKQAEIAHKSSGLRLDFYQFRIESAYLTGRAIKQKFGTRRLGDLLREQVLVDEVNALNKAFSLPQIEDGSFSRTNSRQRNLIAYQKGLYLFFKMLENCRSYSTAYILLNAMKKHFKHNRISILSIPEHFEPWEPICLAPVYGKGGWP